MKRLAAGLAVAALVVVPPLLAVTAQGVTVIRAGRLVDTDKGEVRRDQLVVVRGERIASVLPGSARIPAGARLVDLSRYTVVPGLIDCHAHLIGDITGHPLVPLERSDALPQKRRDHRGSAGRFSEGSGGRGEDRLHGMSPMAAIQSATTVAAELMGWPDRVGSIAPGKYADIIAVEGDAMADLASFSKVAFVMKGGTVYKAP